MDSLKVYAIKVAQQQLSNDELIHVAEQIPQSHLTNEEMLQLTKHFYNSMPEDEKIKFETWIKNGPVELSTGNGNDTIHSGNQRIGCWSKHCITTKDVFCFKVDICAISDDPRSEGYDSYVCKQCTENVIQLIKSLNCNLCNIQYYQNAYDRYNYGRVVLVLCEEHDYDDHLSDEINKYLNQW